MATLNPYLNFSGNAEEAFNFYKSIFGGEFINLMRFKDVPPELNMQASDGERIMHIALQIKDSVLMGSDMPESMGQVQTGANFYISIEAANNAEADKFFKGLSEGGKVEMPMDNMFWGAYFGMVKDKYNIKWMISHNNQQA